MRKEIITTLCVSMKVYAVEQRPTPAQCESVAMDLVEKYPVLKDPIGSAHVGKINCILVFHVAH